LVQEKASAQKEDTPNGWMELPPGVRMSMIVGRNSKVDEEMNTKMISGE